MPYSVRALLIRIFDRFGRCPRCARQAWTVSIGSWAVFTFCFVAFGNAIPTRLAFVIAATTFLLWIAHLGIFAQREAAEVSRVSRDAGSGRRDALRTMIQSFIWAAAVTSFPNMALASPAPCVAQNCQTKRQRACWDCCLCQQQNCQSDVNTCNRIWQGCNADCGKRPV